MNNLIFLLVGSVCGFIDSALGMRYGVTSASLLVTFGVVPVIASASVHTAEALVDTVSAFVHHKLDNIDKRIWIQLLIPGVLSAVMGALFLSWLSLKVAKPLVRIILLCMGVIVFYRHAFKYRAARIQLFSRGAALLGFVASFLDVTGGGGWGPIGTPTLILTGSEPRKVVSTIEPGALRIPGSGIDIRLHTRIRGFPMEYDDPHDNRRVYPDSNRRHDSEGNAEESARNPDRALVNDLECLWTGSLINERDCS